MVDSTQKNKDSMKNTLIVALSLCLVSAIIVSGSAVLLKPQRMANKALFKNKNILIAAGLYQKGVTLDSDVEKMFGNFEIRMIDLEQNKMLDSAEVESLGMDLAKYDQRKASKDNDYSRLLSSEEDSASISRRAQYSIVYLLKSEDKIEKIVLPVHGYGLWSTLYGFVALEGDFNTVSGITFYEHGETAGLGGEVDNPRWKANWVGKEIYKPDGSVALTVVKGAVNLNSKDAIHQIDGLSGASLTSRGVQNLIAFWLGDSGFGPVLDDLKG